MQEQPNASAEATPEQMLYARLLGIGMYVGLGCLFVTFVVYVVGLPAPYIPHDELSKHWEKPIHEYLADTQIEAGWSWVTMLGYSDFLNFLGIALLAGVTVVCYLAMIPTLLRKRDFTYAILSLLEVFVLVGAASGMFAAGH